MAERSRDYSNPLRVSVPHKRSWPLAGSQHKIAALKEATAALNAATDRSDIIIKGLNKAINHLQTAELGATIRSDTLNFHHPVLPSMSGDVTKERCLLKQVFHGYLTVDDTAMFALPDSVSGDKGVDDRFPGLGLHSEQVSPLTQLLLVFR